MTTPHDPDHEPPVWPSAPSPEQVPQSASRRDSIHARVMRADAHCEGERKDAGDHDAAASLAPEHAGAVSAPASGAPQSA